MDVCEVVLGLVESFVTSGVLMFVTAKCQSEPMHSRVSVMLTVIIASHGDTSVDACGYASIFC